MEKKYYQIVAETPEDWKVVHKLLTQDGSLEDNIPCHCVECANEVKHSKTRSTYLLTDEEAELLLKNDRIQRIFLDPEYHPEVDYIPEIFIEKHGHTVRNYRSLRKFNETKFDYDYAIPNNRYDGRFSGEFRRTGYQILRCTSEDNPFPSDSLKVVDSDINYYTDGTDVDVIVVDNGCFFGHPEFCHDEYTPRNYIRGNVLSRHGICGVLDLVLDAPYYLDPEWFDAFPDIRLEKRWDGTTVPVESVARAWWQHKNARSPSFPDFGGIYVRPDYTRERHCGKDQKTPPTNPTEGDHGTPCASLAFGKNFGWAFNSNKWSICQILSNPGGGTSEGQSIVAVFDMVKVFHQYKPVNPKFGTKNPTVSSNSWGAALSTLRTHYYNDSGAKYSYRNGSPTRTDPLPSFLERKGMNSTNIPYVFSTSTPFVAAGEELVDSGVIFVGAAGNDYRYIGTPSDEDYNNHYTFSTNYQEIPGTVKGPIDDIGYKKFWTNRPGFPLQIGKNYGTLTRYKTFAIGAIDDEYTGRPEIEPNKFDPLYANQPSGKETLARNSEFTAYYSPGDYSNKGSGIDFYAPADGTLAAASFVANIIYQNPYQKYSDITYNDTYFNGTSAACPVAAGLIACFLQNNRDLASDALKLKDYLRSNIRDQNGSEFFHGPRPGNDPDDPAWNVQFSVMGRRVKIIKEVTNRSATPNPTFTRTFGINPNSGANERFVVTQNSFIDHKIEIFGIKNFDETPATYELNVKVGYYKVGASTWLNLTYDELSRLKLRIDPTNPRKIQLSDTDGKNSWDDMEITVTNGIFLQSTTEIYYVFSGGSLSGNSAYSSSSATGAAYSPASGIGSITSTGGDLVVTDFIKAGGDIIGLVSDERLKTNIKPIENALDKLEQLEGFTYNFNEIGEKLGFDPDKRHVGVSAQEVQNVLPEASAPAPKDNNYLTVKYDKLIPLLIESVKNLKNDIDDLKKNDNK